MLEGKEPFIKKPMMDNYDTGRMRQTSENDDKVSPV